MGVDTLAIASLNFDSPVYFYFFRLYRVLTYLVFSVLSLFLVVMNETVAVVDSVL